MQNLKALSKELLVDQAKRLAQEERKIQLEMIEHLREIDSRLLHLEMGYGSLHEFVVKELGYSDGAAHRRIAAMRLSRDVPEVKEKLEDGSLSLSTVAMVQTFLRTETFSREEKKELVQTVVGKSTHETKVYLAMLAPEARPPEKERAISETEMQIQFVADAELQGLLERVRELKGKQGYADLFKMVLREYLKKADPVQKSPQLRSEAETVHVSQATRSQVWKRDGSQCTHRDLKTGRRCTVRHGLQLDHLQPRALGGGHEVSNLVLRCRAHNLFAAVQYFGDAKMKQYWKRE